jgi:hypothetical protein
MEGSVFIYPVSDISGRFPMGASEYNSSYILLLQNIIAEGVALELLKQ